MCWGRCRPAQQAHTRAGGTWCRHSGSAGHAWCAHRAQGGQEGWWAASLRHCVREEQDWADGLDCTACMGSIPVCVQGAGWLGGQGRTAGVLVRGVAMA